MGPNSDIARRVVDPDGQPATRLPPIFGRALDVSLAFIALVIFAPMMLIVAILVAAERSGPVLFKHTDPPSFRWTPMLAFRSWRGVSDGTSSAPDFSGGFQARGC